MAQQPPGGGYPPPPPGGGYPPPPPGGGYPPPPGGGYPPAPGGYPNQPQQQQQQAAYDPYAAERALSEWASQRGYTLSTNPDFAWYQGWYPTSYAFRLARIGRELRAQFGEAGLFLVEAFEADDIKRAAGEDRHIYAFVTSTRLGLRAALRSKSGGGLVNEVASGLGSLFKGSSAGSVLGDPTLEQRFDVMAPSRDEGNRALPMQLRQFLLQSNWKGILETRAGGMICIPFDRRTFDAPNLDWVVNSVGQIYQLAATAA